MNRETGIKRILLCGALAVTLIGSIFLFRNTAGKADRPGGQQEIIDLAQMQGTDSTGLQGIYSEDNRETDLAESQEGIDAQGNSESDPTEEEGTDSEGDQRTDLTGLQGTNGEGQAVPSGSDAVAVFHEQQVKSREEKLNFIQMYNFLFPQELLDLIARNEETVDFVYAYPEIVRNELDTEEAAMKTVLTEEESESAHPLLLQWDERWGAMPYGSSMMALSGCGPTCLAMAAVGMTGNAQVTPADVGMFSMEHGYYTVGEGTSWDLITEGCEAYGLRARSIANSEEEMVQNLDNGRMLICSVSPGDFTQTGHFILIYGYEDGRFQINDPNSVIRSSIGWTYERLKGQLRNIWAMSVKSE